LEDLLAATGNLNSYDGWNVRLTDERISYIELFSVLAKSYQVFRVARMKSNQKGREASLNRKAFSGSLGLEWIQ
jgi:hypothetical protein